MVPGIPDPRIQAVYPVRPRDHIQEGELNNSHERVATLTGSPARQREIRLDFGLCFDLTRAVLAFVANTSDSS